MPSTYDSVFWHQRAQETYALSEQMTDPVTKGAMTRLARRYEKIALRGAYDEARIAFDSAREAFRVSEGMALTAPMSSLKMAVDKTLEEMQQARGAMEVFRSAHVMMVDDVEVLDDRDAAASAR
jgi:hypothetical protein